ncbi:MAG: hypothetical protein WBL20_20505, partial [Sphingobium sp.]
FVRARIDATGVSPSYVEMGDALGLRSRSAVFKIVKALIRDGHLRSNRGRSRGLSLPGVNLRAVATQAMIVELERRGVRL